jgi:hypothetical protein
VAPFRKKAEHHEIHLKYIVMEKLPLNITGFDQGEMQAIAFMVVTDENMIQVMPSNRIEEKSTQDKSKKNSKFNDVTN